MSSKEDFRMKLRMGLVLAGSLAVLSGACAGGGAGGTAGTEAPGPAAAGGETLAQGERPRENQFTREAADHLEQAEAAGAPDAAQPHYQAAVTSAQQAIDADPRNPLPWHQQGRAYIGLGDFVMADSALDVAEELRPIYRIETEGMRERAWIDLYQEAVPLVNGGDYEGAIEVFEKANAIYRERPEVMVTLGQIYAQTEQPEKAIENFRAAQEVIGSERVEQMDSATAADWREQGEQLPTLIANAYMQAGDYPAATNAIRELLAQDPENPEFLRQLASLYVQMEQPDSARPLYDRLLAVGGMTNTEYYQIGVGFYQMDDYDAAADAFRQAAEASSTDRDAVEMWARSLQLGLPPVGEGEDPASPEVLAELEGAAERWMELDPNNRNAYLILAQTTNRMGNDQRAGELVRAIEALDVLVQNLQLQRYRDGGGIVSGSVQNVSRPAGSPIDLTVTIYDAQGNELGSQSTQVSAPAADATANFQVDFQSDVAIAGYTYDIGG
jgi:tetratricopeptide (TPR) repeat protein